MAPHDELELPVSALLRGIAVLIGLLAVAHVLVIPVVLGDGPAAVIRLANLMNLDQEQSVGTLVATTLLLACAVVCVIAAVRRTPPSGRTWRLYAGMFAFLALDERLSLHEGLERLLDQAGPATPLEFAWVIPYGVLAVAVVAASTTFLRRVPPQVSRRLLVGGALYVAGAAGLEVLGGVAAQHHGFESVAFLALAGIEEVLELTGTAVALSGLLHQLVGEPLRIAIRP